MDKETTDAIIYVLAGVAAVCVLGMFYSMAKLFELAGKVTSEEEEE